MPTMLAMNSYDTVCHEHLEYYALRQVKWMADRVGLTMGRYRVQRCQRRQLLGDGRSRGRREVSPEWPRCWRAKTGDGLDGTLEPSSRSQRRVASLRGQLLISRTSARQGPPVAALGASTKGNVLLQYCGLGPDRIEAIGEVNPDKYGKWTPGTWIPVVPERDLVADDPDYLLVLPWHFREFFVDNPHLAGTTLVFPLPRLEIVDRRAG